MVVQRLGLKVIKMPQSPSGNDASVKQATKSGQKMRMGVVHRAFILMTPTIL